MGILDLPENEQRAAVVAEARLWLRTPWHHAADVRGAGVDCGMLLVRVFVDLGLCAPFDPRPYTRDFMLHNDEEMFLGFVNSRTHLVASPRPGDVVLWRHGRLFSHGGIVSNWPIVIHSYAPERMVVEEDVSRSPIMIRKPGVAREVQFYSYWGAS